MTFDVEKEGRQLKPALDLYQYQLKGISFLPVSKNVYQQMPYEEISEEQYNQLTSKLSPINWKALSIEPSPDKFCNTSVCNVQLGE